jgi:hypothetical protein
MAKLSMRFTGLIGAVLLAFGVVASAIASEAPGTPAADKPVVEARIPFAGSTGIRSWRTIDGVRDALLIEGTHNRWYRAELFGSCPDLQFAQDIGFRTDASGSFDRFSSIIVRHDVCRVQSLYEVPAPPRRRDRTPATTPAAAPADEPQVK